jgi:predicted CXXCH cytochrome family protein
VKPALVALWVMVCAVQAQTTRPFSHRLHLRMKLACTTCHTGAAKSTSAQDNLLPARQVCLSCHKEVTIPAPPVTPVNRFNHALHLKMGNIAPLLARAVDAKIYLSPPGDLRAHLKGTNACAACHRGLEESDAVSSAALPRMADCLVCHTQIDPPDSCEYCHARGMKLKPANHTPDFLDSHNRKNARLDKASCAVCHGRRFTCLGCH